MLSSIFKKGFSEVEKIDQEIQERAEQRKKGYAPTFMLKPQETRRITLLTESPITYKEHYLPANAKGNQFKTCVAGGRDENGKPINCPHCDAGNKPANRGAFLIMDHTKDAWTSREGKPVEKVNQIKVWKAGMQPLRTLGSIAQIKAESGKSLLDYSLIIQKVGVGTQSSFTIMAEDPIKFTAEMTEEINSFCGDLSPDEKLEELLTPIADKSGPTVTEAVQYDDDEEASTIRPDWS